jgi:hypothetical protein
MCATSTRRDFLGKVRRPRLAGQSLVLKGVNYWWHTKSGRVPGNTAASFNLAHNTDLGHGRWMCDLTEGNTFDNDTQRNCTLQYTVHD